MTITELVDEIIGNCTYVDNTPVMHARNSIRQNLTSFLEKGQVVYGRVDGDHGWYDSNLTHHCQSTHSALLVNIEPLDKTVTKDEILTYLKSKINMKFSQGTMTDGDAKELATRIERHGIK